MNLNFPYIPRIYKSPNLDLEQISCVCSFLNYSVLCLHRIIHTNIHKNTKTSKWLHFKTFYLPLSLQSPHIAFKHQKLVTSRWISLRTCPHPLLESKKSCHRRPSETYLSFHWTEHEQADKSGHGTSAFALNCPVEY